jgi:hypothetical protein
VPVASTICQPRPYTELVHAAENAAVAQVDRERILLRLLASRPAPYFGLRGAIGCNASHGQCARPRVSCILDTHRHEYAIL